MIKRLQRKFVLIVAVSLLIVEVLIIGVINFVNISSIDADSDNLMNILVDNDGAFPDFGKHGNGVGKGQNISGSSEEIPAVPEETDEKIQLKAPAYNEETKYQTRYFVVRYNKKGNVCNVDTGHIAAISSEQAIEYADDVIESGKTDGYIDHYRYTVAENGEKKVVIFIDVRNSNRTKNTFMLTSILVAAAGYLIVCTLVIIFSKRAVRPVIESFEKQRQFITNAGHEIKTPLAIISANTEVLELTGEPSEWTQSIKNQITRLDELLKNLLHLAKMEEDNVAVSFEDFNISDAVTDAAAPFETLAKTNHEVLKTDISDGIVIHGDEGTVRQLTSILVENAIKYAKDDSEILCSLKKSANRKNVLLCVSNVCENVPQGDVSKLFDRFYRGDESHSRAEGEKKGGYGIGLSIAQAIMEAHKGKIKCHIEGDRIYFTAVFRGKQEEKLKEQSKM